MTLQQTALIKTRNDLKPLETTQKLAEPKWKHLLSNWNHVKPVTLWRFFTKTKLSYGCVYLNLFRQIYLQYRIFFKLNESQYNGT